MGRYIALMPKPASESEKTVALSFTLLYGNPPKGVTYRDGMFRFKGQAAQQYRNHLREYVVAAFPSTLTSVYKAVTARNRCLRYIMGVEE